MNIPENVKAVKNKLFKRKRKNKLYRPKTVWEKLLESERHMTMIISYCGIFWIYGMADELLGPTLIELSCLVTKPIKTMSWLFFSHDLGLLFGTLLGGIIVSRVDRNFTVILCLVCDLLCLSILPVLHHFLGLIIFTFLYGMFLGTPDTLTNVMLIKIFGKEVAPYLQGVHFFYGFGAFISPLIARPFLRETCTHQVNTTKFYETQAFNNLTYDNRTGYWISNTMERERDNGSDVMYAYWMISLLHVPVILSLSWMSFKKYLDRKNGLFRNSFVSLHNDDDLPVHSLDMVPYNPELTFWERMRKDHRQRLLAVTILCSLLMYFYEGLMAMFGGYAYSFAVKSVISMTSDQAAYLTSLYWGFFSVGRFLCIILAFLITPKSMLMGNVTGCLVSSLVLLCGHNDMRAVFIGTSMLGFSLSGTAPTIISMAEMYVDLTAHTTSILVIASALGELTMPVIVGQVFEKIGPTVIPATVFVLSLFGFVAFCLLLTFDNDKAYQHANALWVIARNFLCFGCESEKQKEYRGYRTVQQNSTDCTSSSDISEPDFTDVKDEQSIPKPGITTNKVQPPDMELIDEEDIVGELVYSDNIMEIKPKGDNKQHDDTVERQTKE